MLRGRTLVFTIAAAAMLLLAAGSSAFPPALFVGGNINITKLAGSDAEGLIVVNPVNPDQLFFTVNGFTARRSIDGGFNWTSAASGIDPAKICCDNVAVWDDFGNLFLADLNLKPGFVVDTIPFFYSVDGGASFKTGKSIYKGDVDQPAIDAGGGAGGSKRSVWVTWNTAGTIYASGAEVKGLGKVGSWSKAQAAPGSATIDTGGQFGDVAVGPDGQVLVSWQTSTNTSEDCPCKIYVNLDADGLGKNGFGNDVFVANTNVAKFDYFPAQSNRSVDAEANLAWDRGSGPNAGRVYLVYNDENVDESDNFDVWITHSDNDGATWSTPVKINDDGGAKTQFLPEIAVDQSTGNVLATWYDTRNSGGGNDTFQYFASISTDGGDTWSANLQISTGTSNCNNSGDGFDCGDFNWVTFAHGVGFGTWSDNSNSTADNPDGAGGPLDMYTAQIATSATTCHGRVATVVGTTGTNGDDVIIGTSGDDSISGGGGNDVICAGGGTDDIDPGDGTDLIYGEGGNDTLNEGANPQGADTFIGGPGTDTVTYTNRTGNVTVTLDGKANDGEKKEGDNIDAENIVGGNGNDKLTGDGIANVLTGQLGKDTLSGAGGADTLHGSDTVEKNDSLDCGKDDAVTDTFDVDTGDKVKNCP